MLCTRTPASVISEALPHQSTLSGRHMKKMEETSVFWGVFSTCNQPIERNAGCLVICRTMSSWCKASGCRGGSWLAPTAMCCRRGRQQGPHS